MISSPAVYEFRKKPEVYTNEPQKCSLAFLQEYIEAHDEYIPKGTILSSEQFSP